MVRTESVKYLDGGDIYLRPFTEQDLQSFSVWLSDGEVTAFLELGRVPTTTEKLRDFLDLENKNQSTIAFSIVETASETTIGYCGLFLIDWISRRTQLNILIGEKRFWSRGYGSKSCDLLLHYAFSHLNLNSIQLGVHCKNLRARRAYEKIGFVLEGTRRQFVYCDGEYSDLSVYSVLKSEYHKTE